ncbi:hypothetical protein ACWC09_46065 [Streptomyces sp. NPDC001617]
MSRIWPVVLWLWLVPTTLLTGYGLLRWTHARSVRPFLTMTTGTTAGWQDALESNESGVVHVGYRPMVEFVTESGQSVRATSKAKPLDAPPEVGQQVPVLYQRDRPGWCFVGTLDDYENEARDDWLSVGVCGPIFISVIVGLGSLIWMLW